MIRKQRSTNPPRDNQYKANFLWPHDAGSVEEAGYEVVNANTEEYRQQWWKILLERLADKCASQSPKIHD